MARQTNFGVGHLHLIPPSTASDITPLEAGTLQEISVDFSADQVELMGENAVAVDVRTGALKITGKFKFGEIKSQMLQAVFPAATVGTGYVEEKYKLTTGTVSSAQFDTGFAKALFIDDLGAFDSSGAPLKKKVDASGLASGEYWVDTSGTNAIYKFYSDVTGTTAAVSYAKSTTSSGKTVALSNYLQGQGTKFQLSLLNTDPTTGDHFGIKLWAICLGKFSLSSKNNEFTISDGEFTAYADSSDRVFGAIVQR